MEDVVVSIQSGVGHFAKSDREIRATLNRDRSQAVRKHTHTHTHIHTRTHTPCAEEGAAAVEAAAAAGSVASARVGVFSLLLPTATVLTDRSLSISTGVVLLTGTLGLVPTAGSLSACTPALAPLSTESLAEAVWETSEAETRLLTAWRCARNRSGVPFRFLSLAAADSAPLSAPLGVPLSALPCAHAMRCGHIDEICAGLFWRIGLREPLSERLEE